MIEEKSDFGAAVETVRQSACGGCRGGAAAAAEKFTVGEKTGLGSTDSEWLRIAKGCQPQVGSCQEEIVGKAT